MEIRQRRSREGKMRAPGFVMTFATVVSVVILREA